MNYFWDIERTAADQQAFSASHISLVLRLRRSPGPLQCQEEIEHWDWNSFGFP